jgi:hypothetical protein
MCHGWPHAPFSNIGTGIYGPLTQPTAVVSSYAYPYLRSPRADLVVHFELGRMWQRGKDVWMLGAFNSNRTLYPAWMVYQNYWNMLAAGYKFIAFFSWWDIAVALKEGHAERVPEEVAALTRCGEHAQWVLPAAKHARRSSQRSVVRSRSATAPMIGDLDVPAGDPVEMYNGFSYYSTNVEHLWLVQAHLLSLYLSHAVDELGAVLQRAHRLFQ